MYHIITLFVRKSLVTGRVCEWGQMMDVENFQSLSMAEKLKLWKLKTGRANNNKTPATSCAFSVPTSRTKSPGTSISLKAKSPKPENMNSRSPIPSMKSKDVESVESSLSSVIIQVEDKENDKNNINTSPTLSEKVIAANEQREISGQPVENSVISNMIAVSSEETAKETSQPSPEPQPKKEEEQEQDQQSSVPIKRRDTMALGAPMLASPLFASELTSPGNLHDYRKIISLCT